ncbi:MAG: conjugal transfer protein TraL [Bacillota bacterium]|nr:conjugal transfer protein TraL [Bacillota bacterium]
MDLYVIIALGMELALAIFLLWHEKLINSPRRFLIPALLIVLITLVKASLLDFESNDYLDFLAPWTQFFRDYGFKGLGYDLGNYNPPYMYLLWLFSLFPVNELYLIKLTSLLFDILLAWAGMKLLSIVTESRAGLLTCFFALLLLPTFIINGAKWAQCDSIYSFFGVFSIYLALTDRPRASMACIAASLAFKLQAVFIMPVFVILLMAKKFKLKHFLIFPAAYIIYMLPAMAAGRPFMSVMTLYFSQAATVGDAMNYNSPAFTSLLEYINNPRQLSELLIAAAVLFMLLVFIYAFSVRDKLDAALIIGFTALLVIGIPYLLPHMHDRYFYLAGTAAVILACINPKFFLMPILAELASLHCYLAYFSRHYIVHPRYGGMAMLLVLSMAIVYVVTYKKTDNNPVN